MKRKLWIGLALALLLALLCCGAAMAEILTGSCGNNVTYELNTGTGVLIISGTGPMDDHASSVPYPWYNKRNSIATVVVQNGVTSLGDYAFYYCANLTSVTFPTNTISIGYRTFSECSSLTDISMGKVDLIQPYAFENCVGLTSVVLYNTENIEIEAYAFDSCNGMTSAVFHSANNTVFTRDYAFNKCTGLTRIEIMSDYDIGDNSFYQCSNLKDVYVDSMIGSFYDDFSSCSPDLQITGWTGSTAEYYANQNGIPFISLGKPSGSCGEDVNYTFNKSTGKLTVSGSGDMANYATDSDVPWCSFRTYITSAEIENGVTGIGANAFYGCSDLASVTIPDSVTGIGSAAFFGCTGLEAVTIPDSVTGIRSGAFYGCTGLTSVDIPESVTSIGYLAFANCTGLASATIRNPTVTIGSDDVFSNCAAGLILYGWDDSTAEAYATAANIPFEAFAGQCGDHVSWVFDYDTGKITITGTGPMTNYTNTVSSPFFGRGDITGVIIGEGVTSVGNYAFRGCDDITEVSLPSTLTSIGNYAFYNCFGLADIDLPDGLTSLGQYTFYGCSELQAVTIPAGVGSVDNQTFRYCWNLVNVTVLGKTTSFASNAFSTGDYHPTFHVYQNSPAHTYAAGKDGFIVDFLDKTGECGAEGGNLTYLLDTVTGVLSVTGTGAMADYSSSQPAPWTEYRTYITSLKIGNGITSIGNRAFCLCSYIETDVTIPAGVTSIGNVAFYDCDRMTGIAIPDSVTSIGYSAFMHCAELKNVTIPMSVASIGYKAFSGCASLSGVTILNTAAVIGNSDYDVFSDCPSRLVLHGWPGSTAQTYATAAGISFVPLEVPEATFILPANLKKIDSNTFTGIAAKAVKIPKTVTSISGNPFAGSGVQVIYGYADSAAQTFATAYHYYFVAIDDTGMANH